VNTGSTDRGNTDPNFEDPVKSKYWLKAGSPAIDAGTYIYVPADKTLLPGSVWPTDVVAVDPYMDGTQREIGAYAYGGNTDNAPVVKCPSNLIQNDITLESFTTIQAAIDDYNAADFDTIQIAAANYDEDILYRQNTVLALSGGYDCDFSNNPFKSSIKSLTITSGTILVENIVIN